MKHLPLPQPTPPPTCSPRPRSTCSSPTITTGATARTSSGFPLYAQDGSSGRGGPAATYLAEVGLILDVSPSAVAGRQRRALQKLQRCLEEIELKLGSGPSTWITVLTRWRDLLEPEANVDRDGLGTHDGTRA